MEYITEILGVEVIRTAWNKADKLPYFLNNEYQFEMASFDGIQCLIIKPFGGLGTLNVIKKHLKKIREVSELPVVFELSDISRQRRASLIDGKIPFIIPGKQLYLPFFGIHLQDRFKKGTEVHPILEKLLPSAQMILFYFILGKNKHLHQSELSKRFGFSPMTISRAVNQLTQIGLTIKKTEGIQNILTSDSTPKDLFLKSKPYLINPVRKTFYIDKSALTPEMFHSGLSALSDKSMLNPPIPEIWGTVGPERSFEYLSQDLIDTDKQVALELWKYDPRIISGDDSIDTLSLVTNLKNAVDDRVELMLDNLLKEVF